jgi:hypothetical protein
MVRSMVVHAVPTAKGRRSNKKRDRGEAPVNRVRMEELL